MMSTWTNMRHLACKIPLMQQCQRHAHKQLHCSQGSHTNLSLGNIPLTLKVQSTLIGHGSQWIVKGSARHFTVGSLPMHQRSYGTGLTYLLISSTNAMNSSGRYSLQFVRSFRGIRNVPKSGGWCQLRQVRFCNSKGGGTSAGGNGAGRKIALPKSSDAKRLLLLAKPEKWKLAAAIGLLVISSAVTMAVPFGIGRVIDIIYNASQDGNMIENLQTFCKILLVVFIVGAFANFGRVYIMQSSGNRIVKRLREILFSSILRQEVAFFDKTKTGELVNRLSTDTSLVGQSVTMNISDGLRSIAQAAAGIGMMIFVSPKLALIALSIVPPIALLSRFYGRYVQRITKDVQDSLADATQVAEERLANLRTVRAFSQEGKEMAAYNNKIDHVLNLSYKEALARAIFWGSTGLSGNLIILTVFYNGGLMMNDAQMTVGQLSSFLLYAAFVGVSIGGMSTFYTELMRGLGASSRLWQLVDRVPVIPLTEGRVPSEDLKGAIQFQDVCFSYPSRADMPILSGLTLDVTQGKVLAVVGASGSGKSTLASLILRYYDPDQGSVAIDGVDIRELNPQWLRGNMGVVSQEPILFSSSIRDNIAYGALEPAEVSSAQITEAAKMANAYNFIESFPQGLDTLVGERGVMLSGGQKQRIAIARAIIKNPKILLLDEATSALDAESEHLVQEALERVMVGRTVVTIAHRLSTIKNADHIAVLDQGRVRELGSYEQLMALPDGMFKKLVERQTIGAGDGVTTGEE